MGKVALVTDSTADFSLDYYGTNEVVMVPLTVFFGEEQYRDWEEMEPKEFYRRLRETDLAPRTSQPAPAEFAEVYRRLAADHDLIISCHLSSQLSGTINSAEGAKEMVPEANVEIVDSRSVSMGLSLIVDRMVKDRQAGMPGKEILERARRFSAERRLLFALKTLVYLERGGRLGKGAAFLGSVLNVKPILQIDGEVLPYKRVRGESRIIPELVEYVKANSKSSGNLDLAIGHADNRTEAKKLKAAIDAAGIKCRTYIESDIGAVIGTYAGPDAIGIAFYEDK